MKPHCRELKERKKGFLIPPNLKEMLKRSRRKEPRERLTGNLKNAEGKDWPQFCCDIMSGV